MFKYGVPIGAALPLLDPYRREVKGPHKHLYTHIHSSVIHSQQKVEVTQTPTDGGRDK